MITSKSNQTVKRLRRIQSDRRFRHKEQAYVVEGTRWLRELIRGRIEPNIIVVTGDWLQAGEAANLLQALPSVPIEQVSDQVMDHISDTQSPSGFLAEIKMIHPRMPSASELILVLDRVSNPGNMGAILRVAAASNVGCVLLAPNCVDIYNPKVVRSGMGAHLHLPINQGDWSFITQSLTGYEVWLAIARKGEKYDQINWEGRSALIIGGEAAGVSAEAMRLTTNMVSIPLQREIESLNVAVAAGIILFEIARQRN